MTNRDDRLKPCPFCGGEADLSDALAGKNGMSLRARNPRCKQCGADHGYYLTPQDAIAGWNRRTPITHIDGDSVIVSAEDIRKVIEAFHTGDIEAGLEDRLNHALTAAQREESE